MSKTPSVLVPTAPLKGCRSLASGSAGQKVLRPGGRETTNWLLARALGGDIDVVEFAPGLGITRTGDCEAFPQELHRCGILIPRLLKL